MNTIIEPSFSVVDDQTLKIVAASLDTLTTQKTLGDLASTYAYARANHVDFNLTAIDRSAYIGGTKSFDTANMRRLYEIGYDTATAGNFWRATPPGVSPHETPHKAAIAAR